MGFLIMVLSGCEKAKNIIPQNVENQAIQEKAITNITAPYDCGDITNPVTTKNADIVVVPNVSYSNGTYVPDAAYGKDSLNSCAATNLKDTLVNGASSLVYDVYYLNPSKYTYNQLPPALILFHSGGFSDCSNKDGDGMLTYCREFTKRGFIVFNVEYRRGRLKDLEKDINGNMPMTAAQKLATYRAFQDGRGAIRSIVKANIEGVPYRFDSSNIFVGGVSAGAYIALNIGFFSKTSMIDQVFSDVKPILGSINPNYYKGNASIKYTVKAVVNMWGGMYYPSNKNPVNFFSQNERNPPAISFGGFKDPVVPTGLSQVNYSTGTLSKDSIPNAYTFKLNSSSPALNEYGASGFYDLLKSDLQRPSELYVDCAMGHGLDDVSDFGTSISNNKDSLRIYQVQRTATFFQSVINGVDKYLTTTRFVDCENYRYGCNRQDNNNGCNNSVTCN